MQNNPNYRHICGLCVGCHALGTVDGLAPEDTIILPSDIHDWHQSILKLGGVGMTFSNTTEEVGVAMLYIHGQMDAATGNALAVPFNIGALEALIDATAKMRDALIFESSRISETQNDDAHQAPPAPSSTPQKYENRGGITAEEWASMLEAQTSDFENERGRTMTRFVEEYELEYMQIALRRLYEEHNEPTIRNRIRPGFKSINLYFYILRLPFRIKAVSANRVQLVRT